MQHILKFILITKKSNTSMKKLFALLVVAGMVFVSCGNSNTTEPEVEAEGTEVQAEQTNVDENAAQADVETPAETPAE